MNELIKAIYLEVLYQKDYRHERHLWLRRTVVKPFVAPCRAVFIKSLEA